MAVISKAAIEDNTARDIEARNYSTFNLNQAPGTMIAMVVMYVAHRDQLISLGIGKEVYHGKGAKEYRLVQSARSG